MGINPSQFVVYNIDNQYYSRVAPALALLGVINFMKTLLLYIALVIATTPSFATGFVSPDPADSGTNVLGNNNVSTPLSVTLTSFRGELTANQAVDIRWTTIMESGVAYFAVQRSIDGVNFEDIDSVVSQMTISTHVYSLLYSYEDVHPLAGISYYRVKVVGKSGYTTESPVVFVKNSQDLGTKIYPTLIQNNMVFVESDKNLRSVKFEFFDLSGKKISEKNWDSLYGKQSTQISNSGILPTGTYIARLTANGQNIKTQLVIVQGH